MTWFGIFRLGLVQACLGAIVVLTTSTLNRVMVVELGLAAMVPGALVALHYAVQMARPRMGFGSDVGRRRTPWIAGGMAVLALGGAGAALATAWMSSRPLAGMALAAFCFFWWAGRQRLRHLAACVAGHASARRAPCGRRHGGVGDDDRGLCRHGRAGRALSRPLHAGAPGDGVCHGVQPGLLRGDAGLGRPGASGPAPCRQTASPRSALHWRRSGKSPMRAASRSSCSSRCWPTARRT
jgi:hypothetical protein